MHHPDVLWGQDTVSGHKLPGLGGFSAAGADKGTGTVQAERSASLQLLPGWLWKQHRAIFRTGLVS